jgi:hypothetical protein
MNRRWISIVFGIALIAVSSETLDAGQEFSMRANLRPLRLSYDDISNMMEKISGFLETTNRDNADEANKLPARHSLAIKTGESTVLVKDDLLSIDFSRFPKEGYELRYQYYDYKPNNSITQVSIELSDDLTPSAVPLLS